jgi:hypothetical protein
MAAREGESGVGLRPAWALAVMMLGAGLGALGVGLAVSGRSGDEAWAASAAQEALSAPGNAGALVSTSVLSDSEVVICIVVPQRHRLAVYVADAKKGRLRMLAVRDISADWTLADWNNDPPLPKDVRARVDKLLESGKPDPGAGGDK